MTYGDVRGACLALIKTRLGGGAPGGRQPAALGWKLTNAELSAAELAALCAAWIADSSAEPHLSTPRRWRASPVLRAFLAEYRDVRQCAAADSEGPARARCTRPRRVGSLSDRRGVNCDS